MSGGSDVIDVTTPVPYTRLREIVGGRWWGAETCELERMAAELLAAREALRAADALADGVEARLSGPSGECLLCGGGDIFSERDHGPNCPLITYRATRGAR